MDLNMTLRGTEPETSLFDCKLTPHRTDHLINGYYSTYPHIQIPTDIIKIIILYFNHITYYNPYDIDNINKTKRNRFKEVVSSRYNNFHKWFSPEIWHMALALSLQYDPSTKYQYQHPNILIPKRKITHIQDIRHLEFQLSDH